MHEHLHVAPYVGAWIETTIRTMIADFEKSHPMWVRGLKLVSSIVALAISSSHPMWVRGLKLEQLPEEYKRPEVAPYVGAWIETILRSNCTVI